PAWTFAESGLLPWRRLRKAGAIAARRCIIQLRRHCELDGHLGNVQISKPDLDGAARHRIADCILADLFEVAMEISRRIDRGASVGATADGAGLLHPRRHWSP